MKLLRELGLNRAPDIHLSLYGASVVTALRYARCCYILRDEVECGRLPAFHVLPGLPRIRFRDLVNWYEEQDGKIPNKYRAGVNLNHRMEHLLAGERAFAYQCTNYALKVGLLERERCIYCGAPAEAHHPDYTKPLWILWLCFTHHNRQHARLGASEKQLKRTGKPAQLELFTASWFLKEALILRRSKTLQASLCKGAV